MKNKDVKLKKIEIVWVDSIHDSGWMWNSEFDIDDFEKEMEHRTIGYLLKETKTSLIVCQSHRIGKDDILTDARMAIPKKVIIKKIIL